MNKIDFKKLMIVFFFSVAVAVFMALLVKNTVVVHASGVGEVVASPSDPVPDQTPYLSLSQETEYFDDVYILLLSIRNCLIVLIGGLFCAWAHHVLKSVISRFTGGWK